MKIALCQQNYHIGNFEANTAKIIAGIEQAKRENAALAVFSELCVCGYPPRDFLEFEDFITRCYAALDEIKKHTNGIGALVGCPARNTSGSGKSLFNAAFLLYNNEIIAQVNKTLLPNYDVFDEYRYFEPAFEWNTVDFCGKRLAITVCEDIWNMGNHPIYRQTPMELLVKKQQPDLMINLSASPYNYAQDEVRKSIVRANVLRFNAPMIYCNTVGSQTEIVFDGGSLVCDANGNFAKEMDYFKEDFFITETDELLASPHTARVPANEPIYYSALDVAAGKPVITYLTEPKNIEEIHAALVLGIADYFKKMNFSKAILGASGGIDSAVVQALAVEALGKENVFATLMPSQFSSSHSVDDAVALCKNLGCDYEVITIKNIYEAFMGALLPRFKELPFSVAEENLQSRTRGNLLMAMANKFNYILLNTSNKSELATGYGTLYGDMAGGLSVLGDVYKTQIYALAKHINRNGEIIPENIISKAPSAELKPDQKDSDSLPDYAELDDILFRYIEMREGPKAIAGAGFSKELVDRVLKMVNKNEYKRNQFCPIIRVSSKAFGIGRRVPIVAKYLA